MRSAVTLAVAVTLWAPRAAGQTRFTWPDTSTVDMSKYSIEACRAMADRVKSALVARHVQNSRVWWDTMPVNPLDSDSEPPMAPDGRLDSGLQGMAFPMSGLEAEARRCAGARPSGASAPLVSDSAPMSRKLISRPLPMFDRYFKRYDFVPMFLTLFRDAGSDADIKAYVDRYLQGASSAEVATRLARILRTLAGFHETPAKRWRPLSEELVLKYAPRVTDRVQRALFYWYMVPDYLQRERFRLDTVTSLRAATRVQKFITDSLTAPEREKLWQMVVKGRDMSSDTVGAMQLSIGRDVRYETKTLDEYMRVLFEDIRIGRESRRLTRGLDSLRKSTAAYLAFWRSPTEGGWSEWKRTADGKDSVLVWRTAAEGGWGGPVGLKMPPITGITGMTWAGPPVNGPRPTPGRVSLVYFSAPDCRGVMASADENRDHCAPQFIALRRIVDSFPSLEVTVVTGTARYFKYVADSMTPAREAELFRQSLASYGITNVPVAMWARPFVKLPEPDGRAMERDEGPFKAFYGGDPRLAVVGSEPPLSFDRGWGLSFPSGAAMLVDENGVTVYYTDLGQRNFYHYGELAEFIKVLLKRSKAAP